MPGRTRCVAAAVLGLSCASAAPPADRPDAGPLPVRVAFARGAEQFAAGDQVTITDVCGTAADLSAGNIYCVRGTYTLASHERAALAAFTTAAAGGGSPPTLQVQTAVVARGSGAFTLYLPMPTDGYPHVSFYPPGGGGDFGGVYFGTGPSVLAKWWGPK